VISKAYNPERSLDPFWDQVIAAHDSVITYPGQAIEVSVGDRFARVWYGARNDAVFIESKIVNPRSSNQLNLENDKVGE
jgi:hypothetical protein